MTEPDATSILGISMPSFNEKYIDRKTVTFFLINITDRITNKQWTLEKRFSEFKNLHDRLSLIISNLPPIPGVTLFKVSSFEALTKRRLELEAFLRASVTRKDIMSQQAFKNFLNIDKEAPELIGNDISRIFEYTKPPLGVRDFILVPHKEIMLMCCSDMNIISRADSMLTNFTFPWEKKTESHIPLGAAFIYQCKPTANEDYIIHKIWAKSFPMQTGVISWEDETEVYSVGLDDGKIYCFKAKPESYYLEMIPLMEFQLHKDRVMGLGFDKDTNFIYSCSTDRTFYMTDVKRVAPQLISISSAGYTNLNYDKKNERIFLTNEIGEFFVFLIRGGYPKEELRLQVSSKSCIRAFHIDKMSNLIFTGSVNGRINILNLGQPGKERLISEISSFGASMKIRICRHYVKCNDLITGDEDGRVTIWSLKTGQPIYVWEAHNKTPITQMEFDEKNLLLWTGGKDKAIRVWKIPQRWFSEEVYNFEEHEVKKITSTIASIKIQNTIKKKEDDDSDSDDDDLNGWDYKPY